MVVYTCVCCKFETNHKNKYERHLSTKKHIDTSIVEDDRYKALDEKYKTLEEKYKTLEEKYKEDDKREKYKEEKYKEEKYKKDDNENDKEDKFLKDQVDSPIMGDKVYNAADMLSKSQYQTPSLEELKLEFHCGDYERNPVDGMIQVVSRSNRFSM